MQLTIPSFELPDINIFNLRKVNWQEYIIKSNVEQMLKCAEKYGIIVKSINFKQKPTYGSSELRKTISRILEITLVSDLVKETILEYEIPWLVDNHFFIGGHKKIPIFQLYDKPVITRNEMIKVRTNIHTFTLYEKNKKRNDYAFYIDCLGKESIPFVYILCSFKTNEEILKEFGVNEEGNIINKIDWGVSNYNLDTLIADICYFFRNEDHKKKNTLSKFFSRKSNVDVIENIKLVTEVDIFTKHFLRTDNVIDELIYILKNGNYDELNYENKRVRFTEYVIYYWLAKDFYNMIINLKSSKKGRFCNNSKTILSNINTSDITQFDFCINPLAQEAMITRVTLTGPGGFEKDNVPSYLRDLTPSMIGRVCPADTGDRESCGVTQYFVPILKLNDDMSFKKEFEKHVITSISVSHVPFLEHDDPTRLQMSSSQQRHSIMLEECDLPLIQSGIEGMYTKYTTFIFVAEKDGEVVFVNNDIIIVKYKTGECKAFNIGYKKLALSICDFYHVYFKKGDKFTKGTIIAESNYFKKGRLCLGKNLLTCVMVWHGYNYEDAIIVSDRVIKDNVFTSVHYLDLSFEVPNNKVLLNLNDDYTKYKPIPKIGDVLKVGDIYAKIKTISSGTEGNVNNDMIFDEPHELKVNEDCIITDVQIYSNKYNQSFPQYKGFIEECIKNKRENKSKMVEVLSQYLTQDELDSFLEGYEIDKSDKKKGAYKIKGDSIDGLIVEITAVYKRPITVGDKIGNRHGNKGVISKICPYYQMPKMADGRIADVVINPLGIISRMNIGQLFELHLAMSVNDLKTNIFKMFDEGKSKDEISKYILDYIKIIDSTKDNNYYKQMENYLSLVSLEDLKIDCKNFYIIQPPFESVKIDQLFKAMQYTNSLFEFECYDAFLDEEKKKELLIEQFKKNIKNNIAFGYMYFMKLNHIAKDKIASRGVGPYATKTCQPLDGKGRKGGQRLGEMEVWALAAHGATKNLDEMLTTKSDSIKKRNLHISHMIHNDDMLLDENEDEVSQSVRLFQYMLMSLGIKPEINEDT